MELIDYLKGLPKGQPTAFAGRCGVPYQLLYQIATGRRKASPELAVKIERESGGDVPRPTLRKEDWRDIWPELAEKLGEQVVA